MMELFPETRVDRSAATPAEVPYSWWASLNHGGLLIAPSKLAEHFPARLEPMPPGLGDRLRRDLTRLREGGEERLATFLDTVLEDVLGLSKVRWTKGSEVSRAWSRPAVTREIIRPRRVWLGPNGAVLPVFVADASLGAAKDASVRLGVGRGKRPVSRVVEWLRRVAQDASARADGIPVPRVALLATGRQLRLLHAGSDYDAFCEWDTALWFQEGGPGLQVDALRALLSAESVVPKVEGQAPPLLAAIQASRQGQAELSSALGERVRQAVELLIRESSSALERIDAGDHLDAADPARVARRDIYVAATRIVMRCVVILFAEARELLPRSNAIYEQSYGIQGLRSQLDRLAGGRAAERLRHSRGAWPRILSLFRLVYHGSQHEALPVTRYGGGLFTPGDAASADPILRALAAFESAANAPSDHAVHAMLELLCRSRVRVRQGRTSRWVEAPVDFSDLSSEYIGILYEGLLDFELRRAPADDAMLFLNLGDQPVLPLARLREMMPDALAQLLDKLAKSGEKVQSEEGDEADGEAAEPEAAEPGEDTEPEDAAAGAEPLAEAAIAGGAGEDLAKIIREMVQDWAERAVKAAKLVKYPKKDHDPRVREQYGRDVAAKARGLVQRLILPGGWYLVRWGGTRKGSGTFYTRPQLAGPIVRRALQPLAYAPVHEAKDEATGLVTVTEWAPRKPEEILALKVCDPAMGSGSFLISALRYLTDALVESLHHHGRLEERPDQTICRLADGLPVEHPSHETLPVPKDHPELDERLRARLKRYVVERCLYGVDLDPLAVELARTALWVETMDWQLPFGFLDHKLKCGNALVGCWFDRFQDYPIMAWEREGGDKGHDRFVHHYREVVLTKGKDKGKTQRLGDKWTAAIKDRREDVIKPELRSWLLQRDPTQVTFWEAEGRNADALHAEALAVFEELHRLPVDKVEEREALYREKIQGSEPLQRLKTAFDTWCALWFWPGDELDMAPGPKDFLEPGEEARKIVERLAGKYRFFHWELELADVFTGPQTGFHAVVGNPPWEIQKPSSMEFFSNRDPLYRTYGKQEALQNQSKLFESSEVVEREWIDYSARFKALSNWTKNVAFPFGGSGEEGTPLTLGRGTEGEALRDRWRLLRTGRQTYSDAEHPFRYQGSADINTYKMFLEAAHALLGRGGDLGLLVPSGIYTDNGSRGLRELFLQRCAWTHLYAFQNERFVFEGIHHSFKMTVVHVRKGGRTEAVLTRFRIGPGDSPEAHEVEDDLLDQGRYLSLRAERIKRFSPTTGSILEVRTARDLAVLEKLYTNGVLLGDAGPEGWGIQYAREFDMTNDSKLFPPRPQWEAKGYKPDEYGHWLKGTWQPYSGPHAMSQRAPDTILSVDGAESIRLGEIDDVALPLYQGIMVRPMDPTAKGWLRGTGLRATWEEIEAPRKRWAPQYLMAAEVWVSHPDHGRELKLAYREVARSTDSRTFIGAGLPSMPCGHKLPLLLSTDANAALFRSLIACGVANSFTYDWLIREKLGATALTWFFLQDTPFPRPGEYSFVALIVARINLVHARFARSWLQLHDSTRLAKSSKALWAVTPHERLRLRAILDAVVAELYGLDLADFAWILRDCDHPTQKVCDKPFSRTLDPKGFWRVDKEQDPELRHTVLSLVAFHELKRIGLDAFLALNDGDGWMLPDTLRLADYGLGHDDRANQPQPVASRLGERFLPWQLEQGVEESWEECRRHAETIERILGIKASATTPTPAGEGQGPPQRSAEPAKPVRVVEASGQAVLFNDAPAQRSLFDGTAEVIPPKGKKRK